VFGRGGGTLLAQELEVPLLATIELDSAVREGGDGGEPIVARRLEDPAPRAATNFLALADAVVERAPKRPERVVPPAERIKKPLPLL
jgi:ATP-binding protein involved in chromosome partitioning